MECGGCGRVVLAVGRRRFEVVRGRMGTIGRGEVHGHWRDWGFAPWLGLLEVRHPWAL